MDARAPGSGGGSEPRWLFLPFDQVNWPDHTLMVYFVLCMLAAVVAAFYLQHWWRVTPR